MPSVTQTNVVDLTGADVETALKEFAEMQADCVDLETVVLKINGTSVDFATVTAEVSD